MTICLNLQCFFIYERWCVNSLRWEPSEEGRKALKRNKVLAISSKCVGDRGETEEGDFWAFRAHLRTLWCKTSPRQLDSSHGNSDLPKVLCWQMTALLSSALTWRCLCVRVFYLARSHMVFTCDFLMLTHMLSHTVGVRLSLPLMARVLYWSTFVIFTSYHGKLEMKKRQGQLICMARFMYKTIQNDFDKHEKH